MLPLASKIGVDFPYSCAPGVLGGTATEYQLGSLCAGLWFVTARVELWTRHSPRTQASHSACARHRSPAGKSCAEPKTLVAAPCEAGGYCPEGTSRPLPCQEGTFSSAEGLQTADQCTACPAGSFCSSGAVRPTKCSPGTMAPHSSMPACDRCEAGTYQAFYGSTGCEQCPLLGYCEQGAAAPSSCVDGTYGHVTGLR